MPDSLLELPTVGTRVTPLDALELGARLLELRPCTRVVDLPRVHGIVDERDRAVELDLEEARAGGELANVRVGDVHPRRAGLSVAISGACRARTPISPSAPGTISITASPSNAAPSGVTSETENDLSGTADGR